MKPAEDIKLSKRFWSKVQIGPDCWEWTGSVSIQNDGQRRARSWFNGRDRQATHVLWEGILRRDIPPGHVICHHCDNPSCVRPSHLFLGTQKDNIRDAVKKGRLYLQRYPRRITSKIYRGEEHGAAKIGEDAVHEIRERAAAGEQQKHLAAEFGLSTSAVGNIVRRETWRHV